MQSIRTGDGRGDGEPSALITWTIRLTNRDVEKWDKLASDLAAATRRRQLTKAAIIRKLVHLAATDSYVRGLVVDQLGRD